MSAVCRTGVGRGIFAFRPWCDFAAKQNQGADGFVATGQTGAEAAAASREAALKGMEEMSRRYNEGGRELYVGQGDRERD